MLTLVRNDDTMTSIAQRIGMLRTGASQRSSRALKEEFEQLDDHTKEALEAEFSRRLLNHTAERMRFYPVLAEEYLGVPYAA